MSRQLPLGFLDVLRRLHDILLQFGQRARDEILIRLLLHVDLCFELKALQILDFFQKFVNVSICVFEVLHQLVGYALLCLRIKYLLYLVDFGIRAVVFEALQAAVHSLLIALEIYRHLDQVAVVPDVFNFLELFIYAFQLVLGIGLFVVVEFLLQFHEAVVVRVEGVFADVLFVDHIDV